MTDSRPYDVVVVGGGGAGLTAALTARRKGARVLLVEAGDQIGGTYAKSSGLIWIPLNHLAAADGIIDKFEWARDHMLQLGAGRNVPALVDRYLTAGPEAIRFLVDEGVPFDWVPGYPDYYAERAGGLLEGRYLGSPVFEPRQMLPPEWIDLALQSPFYRDVPVSWREIQDWGGYSNASGWNNELIEQRKATGACGWGGATTGFLLAAALKAGVDISLETRLTELIVDEHRSVAGAIIKRHGDTRTIMGPVILASGGYDNNPEMQRRFDPHPQVPALGHPSVDGSAIQLAMDLGASFVNLNGQLVAPVYRDPDRPEGWGLAGRESTFPGAIVVNSKGRRFADDSYYRSLTSGMSIFDPVSCTYPNFPAYLIFDEEFKRKYRLGQIPRDKVPEWLASGSAGHVGARLGIDGAELARSIARYNEDCRDGVDHEYGRGSLAWTRAQSDASVGPNPTMRALQGKLFGVELTLATMGTYSGLLVDDSARVLRGSGEPIRGLYAAGNVMANLVEGYWYNSGTSNGRSLVFGYVAALAAVDLAVA